MVAGRRKYTDDDRSSALAKLAENGGDVSRTARDLGIPERTLNHWANGHGIHPDVAADGERKKLDLAERWEKVANAALDILDRDGKDLPPREAATVAAIATDKMMLLRGETPASATVVVVKVSGDWMDRL